MNTQILFKETIPNKDCKLPMPFLSFLTKLYRKYIKNDYEELVENIQDMQSFENVKGKIHRFKNKY